MQSFLYETHMHTIPASGCSDTLGRDYIKRYIDAGYAGIMITDHFWRGNCGVDRTLPWPEFVKQFCSGYEDALNEGLKYNFPVFFGWEETFDGDDYLVYGLDKRWLLDHPEVIHWTKKEQYDVVHQNGGCVVQAHPFRAAYYIHGIHLTPYLVDGVEGYNCGNRPEWNISGMHYARMTGLPITAGSDNHHATRMCKEILAGVVFSHPLNTLADYIRAIRTHEPFDIHIPSPIPDWTDDIVPELPVYLMNSSGQEQRVDGMDLLRNGYKDSAK